MQSIDDTILAKKGTVTSSLLKPWTAWGIMLRIAALISVSLIGTLHHASDAETPMVKHLEQSATAGLAATSRLDGLGVTVQDLTPDLAQALGLKATRGALIASVESDSPAAQAGLMHGDTIIGFHEQSVQTSNDLITMVAESTPGTTVPIRILRRGEVHTLQVALAYAADLSPHEVETRLGMIVKQEQQEVRIVEIIPDSPAAQSGLQPGDVIREVNQIVVDTIEAYHTTTSMLRFYQPALLLIERGGSSLYIAIKSNALDQSLVLKEQNSRLTERDVQQALNTLNAAIDQKDIDGIIQHFAPEASVEMTLITPILNKTMSVTRKELYQYFTNTLWPTGWTARQLNFQIQISPDGEQATMTSNTEGALELWGIKVPYETKDHIRFIRLHNKIVIETIRSTVNIESLGGIGKLLPQWR
jgi:hypothetical protein